jgi:hypothetical protein
MTRSIYFLAVVLLLAGCRKYVEIDQIGKRTLKYTKDYRALLDNTSLFEGSFGLAIYSCDDTRFLDSSKQVAMTDIYSNAYTWQAQYWSDLQSDQDWEKLYNVIYQSNVTLDGVMDSESGTADEKKQLYAEALVHRAYAYWCLVNLYAKQYDSTTASTDMAVPLLLSPDLFVNLTRTSVANVYTRIISDLNEALPALPDLPDYKPRPSKAGVYAVLARTYLGVRDFTQARANAEKVLSLQNTILDLRTYATSTTSFPYRVADPEVIFSKTAVGVYTGIQLDTALLSLLGTQDMRYKLFVKAGGSYFPTFNGFGYWRYRYTREGNAISQGPTVPEMMLIKAECAARSGDAATAIDQLNTIRQKRFLAADYTALSVGTAADALTLVVNERKREFFGTGLRWFDQKRLNRDAAFAATVTRKFKGVDYTLEPNSNRYIFPVGSKYILLNSELAQSPR